MAALQTKTSSQLSEQHASLYENDTELEAGAKSQLLNTTVQNYAWSSCTAIVKDKATGEPRAILSDVSGIAEAGEIVALMGPSGSGKTTLLNQLARRTAASRVKSHGFMSINGHEPSTAQFRKLTSFVEQEDTLIGSLTVRETLKFASWLANPRSRWSRSSQGLVDNLLTAFGLDSCADTLVGTPVRKGVSGGQKRRLTVASQLITAPKILFLDEPTSGLDSTASYKVVRFLRDAARKYNLVVIASIHQPSTATFNLFDKVLLLSNGSTCFWGRPNEAPAYFKQIGIPFPTLTNPAEFMLDLVNDDFTSSKLSSSTRGVAWFYGTWRASSLAATLRSRIETVQEQGDREKQFAHDMLINNIPRSNGGFLYQIPILLHRAFIKSYRDIFVYGIRLIMYVGLAVMMGTVWLRLDTTQQDIQPFINAIFFGGAFMSFMAVAYVPAFLEDHAVFAKERANGLYGPTVFALTNFLIGLPYLFLISLIFSFISYWLINFQPTAIAFARWVMWLYLDLLAAEGLVVFMSALFPNFVISLALVAFANGLWMSVGGFLVPPNILNVFWKYAFHYWDYQAYVFQGMLVNEFEGRSYSCGSDCHCSYSPSQQCSIDGTAVLQSYGYPTNETGKWVGIMLAIIAGYRIAGWAVLYLRR